ncbi:MAG: hypothetical protein HC888_13850 [Candidatus Competibacteraceae bacterium]|nr:hypothetical protein [Candidatus Competibacteraceae bacterium]
MNNSIKDQNFLSVDGQAARDSYGQFFSVGEKVGNTSASKSEETAVIQRFELDRDSNEVKAHTDKGWNHIDFLQKL